MKQERNNKLLKLIDRYIGIPLVFLLSIFRIKNKQDFNNANNIGILATAAIGDTIIMSGAINSIKTKYPNSKITLFCGSSNFQAAKLLNNVDKVEKLSIKNILASKKIIQKYSFDIWIDFGPWPRLNSILTYFAIAKYRIGFNTKNQFKHFVFDKWVLHSDILHEHDNYCELLKLINIKKFEKPKLSLKSNIKSNNENYVVMHLYAGGSKADLKQLPLKIWKEIIEYCLDKNYKIYLTGGKSDYEIIKEFLSNNNISAENIAGKLSLKETASIISKAKLVISIDTGIMHLASALNTNLIAIHGPTSPDRWGPLSTNSYTVYINYECSPCISLGFESSCKNNQCMKLIQLSNIVNIIEKEKLL
jgi:heptosyltransferase-3